MSKASPEVTGISLRLPETNTISQDGIGPYSIGEAFRYEYPWHGYATSEYWGYLGSRKRRAAEYLAKASDQIDAKVKLLVCDFDIFTQNPQEYLSILQRFSAERSHLGAQNSLIAWEGVLEARNFAENKLPGEGLWYGLKPNFYERLLKQRNSFW
jgi:hypothetical protein